MRACHVQPCGCNSAALLVLQEAYSCCDATNPNVQMKELYGHQISGMFGALCPAPRIHDLRE